MFAFSCKFHQYFNLSTSFEWDFGNGAQSTLENPSTVYTQPGFYTIQLISFGSSGSDTIIYNNLIEVLPSPTADFQMTQSGPNCEDDNIFSFQNLSTNAISYLGILVMGTLVQMLIHPILIVPVDLMLST